MRARAGAGPLGPEAPGIDLRWWRVGGAGSGTCLGKGPKVGLRGSTRQVKESTGAGLAGEVGQRTRSREVRALRGRS